MKDIRIVLTIYSDYIAASLRIPDRHFNLETHALMPDYSTGVIESMTEDYKAYAARMEIPFEVIDLREEKS